MVRNETVPAGGYDPLGDPKSFIGVGMRSIFDAYGATLVNGEKRAYKDLLDVSRKVNQICHEWAKVPDLREQAVCLRSLYIVRKLERFIHSGNRWQLMDYHSSAIMPDDDFWPRVETSTYGFVERMITELYDSDFKPQAVDMSARHVRQRLGRVHGYDIGRQIVQDNGQLVHFAYAAAHRKRKEFRSQVV